MPILVVTEKPSVSKSISAVLNANEKGDGFFHGNGYIVTWCLGHLIELVKADVYDEKYSKWLYSDLPIIPREWKYAVSKDKTKQLKVISGLMKQKDITEVICATDSGREGELIFRLVYNYCKCDKPIKRLWISSMEEKAIKDGFANLKNGAEYERLYQSALCRAQADWLVGINATRLFSVLYGQTLNIGRVMTPTLALIVKREEEITSFVKEPFYTVDIDCGGFILSGEKLKNKKTAEDIRTACDGKTAVITSIDKKEKTVQPPKLYDLTTLQRDANRQHGFTSQQTLDYLQSLYEKKLATYPRTDSRYLTEDMEETASETIWIILKKLPCFGEIALDVVDIKRITDNSKVSDHHAVIPTLSVGNADLSALPSGEREILHMIAVRLVCAVSGGYIYEETTVTAECESHIFSTKGKTVLHEGWKAFDNAYKAASKNAPLKENEENTLPQITKGQSFNDINTSIREGFTSPPKHFTEDTLLSAMEKAGTEDMAEDVEREGLSQFVSKLGLGTPATRAGIIEKLVKTGFIERKEAKKVKNLIPTGKAVNLIAVIPETIKSAALTAEWESKLKLVEKGELSGDTFINEIAELVDTFVKTHKEAEFEHFSLFNNLSFKSNSVGICPRCGKSVQNGKKSFYCENRECGFTMWKDNKFFTSKKAEFTAEIAAALLKDGFVFVLDLYSEKTGKTYDAFILLDDTGEKYVNFKIKFK